VGARDIQANRRSTGQEADLSTPLHREVGDLLRARCFDAFLIPELLKAQIAPFLNLRVPRCETAWKERLRRFRRAAVGTRQHVPLQPFVQPRSDALRVLPAFRRESAFSVAAAALSVGVTPEYQVLVDSLR